MDWILRVARSRQTLALHPISFPRAPWQGVSMSIALLFWVLMICWFVFGLITGPRPFNFVGFGGSLLLFILLSLLGWQVFGAAIHR